MLKQAGCEHREAGAVGPKALSASLPLLCGRLAWEGWTVCRANVRVLPWLRGVGRKQGRCLTARRQSHIFNSASSELRLGAGGPLDKQAPDGRTGCPGSLVAVRGLQPCTLSLKCQPPDSCQPFQTQLLLASGPLPAATGAALTKAQATALGEGQA